MHSNWGKLLPSAKVWPLVDTFKLLQEVKLEVQKLAILCTCVWNVHKSSTWVHVQPWRTICGISREANWIATRHLSPQGVIWDVIFALIESEIGKEYESLSTAETLLRRLLAQSYQNPSSPMQLCQQSAWCSLLWEGAVTEMSSGQENICSTFQ